MRANVKLLRKHRQFTDEFKKEIVSEFESGKFSVCQLEKLHNISNSILYSWIYKFSTFNQSGFRIVEM
ncbi:MAG TPA: transposase, partial [Flavobacteriaceae bacterium]|nr:transposase [Flavobacteriaceae bacterium]